MEPQVSESRIDIHALPQVSEVKNNKVVIISIAVIVIGIIALVIGFMQQGVSALNTTLIIAGIVLLITGLVLLFVKRKQVVYEVTGSPAKTHTYYLNRSQLEQMKTLLSHGAFALGNPVELSANGNVKMDVVLSNDKRFAAVQLFEYVPFEYQAATKPYHFSEVQATDFANFLGRCPRVN